MNMDQSKKFESTEKSHSDNLHLHQDVAVNIAFKLLIDGEKKILLQLDAGTGKTMILVRLTNCLLKSGVINSALILTSTRMMAEQIASKFYNLTSYSISGSLNRPNDDNHVTIITYSKLYKEADVAHNLKYDIIICDDANSPNSGIEQFLTKISSTYVGIVSSGISEKQDRGWFSDTPIAYAYPAEYSIKDCDHIIVRPQEYGLAVERFFRRFLQQFGYDVKPEPKMGSDADPIYPDLMASSGEQRIVFEIKAYRNKYVSKSTIDTALYKILNYKNIIESNGLKDIYYCLVLLCEVDNGQKELADSKYGITIWDISNILYICGSNDDYLKELSELLYFPITEITPEKPRGWAPVQSTSRGTAEPPAQTIAESLEERLHACKTGRGRKASGEYECICTDIIRFLFESEFTQSSNQHKTGDALFRMDLLCGLKGSSAFWEMLIRHYNTRFVVFEYKNYSELLTQNLIYTTEKYLFSAVLRNVAIIVSRKGFSRNAHIAALGCLKESGKLIIDVSDKDLTQMLHKKIDGEEPADYLLWKLETLLMSVGK